MMVWWWWLPLGFVESSVGLAVLTMAALLGGLAAGLLVALVVGHSANARRLQIQRRLTLKQPRRRPGRLADGLWFGLAAGLSCGLLFGLWVGLQNWQEAAYDGLSLVMDAALAAIVFGLVVGRSGRDPQEMVFRRPTAQDLRRGRRRIVTGGIPAGLGAGVLGIALSVGSSLAAGVLFTLTIALVAWCLFGFILWLLGDVWNLPMVAATDVTPRSVYRKDVQTRLTSAVTFGVMGGLSAGLALSLILSLVDMLEGNELGRSALVDALMVALQVGLILGPLLGLIGGLRDGASPLLLCTEAGFVLRGRPVRFLRLLESARDRQVLRQAGALYQFRHANLQDRLADRYRQEHP